MAKRFAPLALILLAGTAAAAGHSPAPTPPSAATPAADPALLEFLGTWEQDPHGQWVDPMSFAEIDPAKVAADTHCHNGNPVPAAKAAAPGKTGSSGGRAG